MHEKHPFGIIKIQSIMRIHAWIALILAWYDYKSLCMHDAIMNQSSILRHDGWMDGWVYYMFHDDIIVQSSCVSCMYHNPLCMHDASSKESSMLRHDGWMDGCHVLICSMCACVHMCVLLSTFPVIAVYIAKTSSTVVSKWVVAS